MRLDAPVPARPDAFPADPDFPQLAIASDPERMLEVFRAHLKPVGKDLDIQECIPVRFRCRQSSSRCVLQYQLRIADPSTGREWTQWVTGLVYAPRGEAARLWREMADSDPRREIPPEWLTFEPVGFIPDLQMVVEVFPFDRRLDNLARVMRGGLKELPPLLLSRLGWGWWVVEGESVEPARYRTELGAALRYIIRARDLATHRRKAVQCYLKVYRKERGEETLRLLRTLSERVQGGRTSYEVVQPLAYLSELRTLAIEQAPGTPLLHVLLNGPDRAATMEAVARAVAAFNQDDLPIARRHTLADQFKDVERASGLLEWASPAARADIRAITTAMRRGLTDVPATPIHRDLKTDHIFVAGRRVIFIDVDAASLGDPVRDPAHLFAHIVARVGLDALPRQHAQFAADVFVKEYFRRVPRSWHDRFALHAAGALVEAAGGIFKRQEPRWREKVAEALEEASAFIR